MATALTVEERLAVLEKEVAELKNGAAGTHTKPNWIENIAGSLEGDPVFAEILRLGQEIRRAETDVLFDTDHLGIIQ